LDGKLIPFDGPATLTLSSGESRQLKLYAPTVDWASEKISPVITYRQLKTQAIYTQSTEIAYDKPSSNIYTGLIAYWNFDDINSSGDPQDYLGVNNPIARDGAAQTSDGKFGKGFTFDGNDDNVYFNNTGTVLACDASSAQTRALWFKAATGLLTYQGLIGDFSNFGYGWSVAVCSDGHASCSNSYTVVNDGGGEYYGSTVISDGNWHHMVVTYDPSAGNKFTVYLDGSLDANFDQTPQDDGNNFFGLTVGWIYHSDGGNSSFNGEIDEVMIWDRVLTAAEVESLYEAGQ
jgi:hypothetical protein